MLCRLQMEIQNLHLCNTFFTPINVIRIPFLFYQKKIHFYYQPTIAILYYLFYRSTTCLSIHLLQMFYIKVKFRRRKSIPPSSLRPILLENYTREVRAKRQKMTQNAWIFDGSAMNCDASDRQTLSVAKEASKCCCCSFSQ